MPKRSLRIRPGQIKMVIGKPIEVAHFSIETRQELIERVRNEIIKNYNDWQASEQTHIKDLATQTP